MSKKKKNFILAGIISVLAMMIILVPAYVVSSGKPYSEGAGIDSENEMRSQVIVTGSDYRLNYEKEQEIKEAEEERYQQVQKEQEERREQNVVPTTAAEIVQEWDSENDDGGGGQDQNQSGTGSGSGDNGQGSDGGGQTGGDETFEPGDGGGTGSGWGDDIYDQEHEEIKLKPRLVVKDWDSGSTDINGRTYNGSFATFSLTARDYKNNLISDIQFYASGKKLVGVSGKFNYQQQLNYVVRLKDGANSIRIIVTDSEGNRRIEDYVIYGDTSKPNPVGGQVRLRLDLRALNKGFLIDETVDYYKGESTANLIQRVLNSHGYTVYLGSSGSIDAGAYIRSVSKPGMLKGYWISEDLDRQIQSEGGQWGQPTYQHPEGNYDYLEEKDFYSGSGWTYWVKERYEASEYAPSYGVSNYFITGSCMQITLAWTNCIGADYGGVWNPNSGIY